MSRISLEHRLEVSTEDGNGSLSASGAVGGLLQHARPTNAHLMTMSQDLDSFG
jgi:hypothetical protein